MNIYKPTPHTAVENDRLKQINLAGYAVQFAPSVADIPFEQITDSIEQGLLILDCDGTISRHNSPDIQPSADTAIFDAFSRNVFSALVLVSNNRNMSLMHSRARNLRVQPDEVYTPRSIRHIKPASFMIMQAMDEHGFCPDSSVAVGDGVTDVIAYSRAAVPNVLVQPFAASEARGYPLRPLVQRASSFVLQCSGMRSQ